MKDFLGFWGNLMKFSSFSDFLNKNLKYFLQPIFLYFENIIEEQPPMICIKLLISYWSEHQTLLPSTILPSMFLISPNFIFLTQPWHHLWLSPLELGYFYGFKFCFLHFSFEFLQKNHRSEQNEFSEMLENI